MCQQALESVLVTLAHVFFPFIGKQFMGDDTQQSTQLDGQLLNHIALSVPWEAARSGRACDHFDASGKSISPGSELCVCSDYSGLDQSGFFEELVAATGDV